MWVLLVDMGWSFDCIGSFDFGGDIFPRGIVEVSRFAIG